MKSKHLGFILSMRVFLAMLCCSVILSQSKEAFAFTLPDTGQTKCYNTAGTEIACTGTGQDGEYSINPMSYTDNGNGTITDNVTGLMWQKGENATYYNWYVASGTYNATYNPTSQNVCGSLTLGGYSDWRLPTKKELISIVDYSIAYPSPTINTTYFPGTTKEYYWTSTTSAQNADKAWFVDFLSGGGSSDNGDDNSKSRGYGYVRCVRGGQSSASFTDNGNGTVTDNRNGLMWQQGEPGTMTWDNALSYCEGLSLGGHSDWRLPNVKELESITDDTKYNPTIDTTYFPNTKVDDYDYISSTSCAYYNCTHDAWCVSFGGGGSIAYALQTWYIPGNTTKSYGGYVRCVRGVRGGQSGAQNNCAASVSSGFAVHVPILTFNGQSYWADLQYSTGSNFTLSNAGAVTDTSPYSGCTAATLSSSYKLHISALTYNNVSYWADLQYIQGTTFTLTGAGSN